MYFSLCFINFTVCRKQHGASFLTATNGERVEVVQFGVWNREAGPDFTEAAVRFPDRDGAPVLRGSIELDTSAEDWERHGHGANPAFDGVVLHLYLRQGLRQPFTRTSQHRQVAQVQLDYRHIEQRAPPASLPLARPRPLSGPAPVARPRTDQDAPVRRRAVPARNQEPPLATACRGARVRSGAFSVARHHAGLQGKQAALRAAGPAADAQGPARRTGCRHGAAAGGGGFPQRRGVRRRQGREGNPRVPARVLGTLVATARRPGPAHPAARRVEARRAASGQSSATPGRGAGRTRAPLAGSARTHRRREDGFRPGGHRFPDRSAGRILDPITTR